MSELSELLWTDLNNDEERIAFLKSGRAWETGIIAESLVEDFVNALDCRIANPWRYPSRGELPDKRRRSYEVSVSFDGAANVWHSRWDGKRFDLGAVVYAWREMAEPAPPLEPEGAKE